MTLVGAASNPNLSRRDFLAATAGASGGLLLEPAARGADAPESRRIRVGFLGVGHSHFQGKYELIRQLPDYELIGLCEEEVEIRARGPADARWLGAAELFAQAEVVVVESAVRSHAADALRALEAGCHVHLEKPPADSVEGLRGLLEKAAAKQRLLQIGYMWRENPGLNTLLAAAVAGWLGEVFLVRALINTQGDARQRREWAEFGGGTLFELGCHLLDPMVRLLGAPQQVTAAHQQLGRPGDSLTDNVAVLLEFPRALGVLTGCARQSGAGPHRSFEVHGTNGTARLQPIEPPALVMDLVQPAGPYARGRQDIPLPPYRRYVAEFAVLARAIRTGQPLAVSATQELEVQAALIQACRMH